MSFGDYALIVVCAMGASVVGGIAGYGTGLLMPLVLVPLVGAEAVVPILAVAAIFTNVSRIIAFREHIDWPRVWRVLVVALPATFIGAAAYTWLNGPGAAILIGSALILLVPARYLLKRLQGEMSPRAALGAGGVFGLVSGAVPGAGIILISMLMALGLKGPAIIATDAAISFVVGLVKIATYQSFGGLPASSWTVALLIGAAGVPGAFLAKWLTQRLSLGVHQRIMDATVILGGSVLLLRGLGWL
ncbi:MAG: sulfite exporter TauE/SafE family protein [Beijerinckiaceae bacterium]|jgi:uncharacterized protein|nr:sulfite exporter TauE/SafE family protein [Beijerinckiaceae bacterium]MDO9440129.1 sulfite exporter TauE/SafE family protein [Beijerinckiaceae bacterium]